MSIVTKARDLAKKKHKGQRYGDLPYFEGHIQKVVLFLYEEMGITDPTTIAAAYLHDIVEDTDVTSYQLKRDFPKEVVDAVLLLTKPDNGCELEYLLKLATNPIALSVKIADASVNSLGGRPKYKVTLPILKKLEAGELIVVAKDAK